MIDLERDGLEQPKVDEPVVSIIKTNLLSKKNNRDNRNVTAAAATDMACDLTAAIFDPHLPVAEANSPIWGSLESVLAHVQGNLCIVLQTSSCILGQQRQQQQQQQAVPGGKTEIERVWSAIQSRAPLPLLRSALETGMNKDETMWVPTPGGRARVRVSIVDHKRYSLLSCSNFWTPSNAWMNVHYWEQEFTEQDSDMVMLLQDDTVICRNLDPQKFAKKGFAYLGAPWRQDIFPFSPLCSVLERYWRNWNENVGSKMMTSQLFCPDGGEDSHNYYGPAGNGGLSLRSRTWMIKAIRTCPHSYYSGLSTAELQSSSCIVGRRNLFLDFLDFTLQWLYGHRYLIYERIGRSAPEDLYFATVLRGIGAPLPSGFEASLFSAELILPDEVASMWYGPSDPRVQRQMVQELMTPEKEELDRFDDFLRQNELWKKGIGDFAPHFLPIGMHRLWDYHEPEFILSLVENNMCPYLRHVYPFKSVPERLFKRAKELGLG